MPDFSGPVQPVVVSHALVVVLFIPAVAAVVHWVQSKDAKIARTGAVLTALAVVALATSLLAEHAGERFLFQHVVRWLRAGELDANLDLAFDSLAAGALLVASGLAVLGAASTSASAVALLGAVAFTMLAGDLVGATIGLLLVATFAARLLGRGRALAFGAVGTLAVATSLLFWATGGEWRRDGYGSDFHARLAAVAVGPVSTSGDVKDPLPRGQGLLTVSAYPGAPIFVDDSRSPFAVDGHHLYTPFSRVALPGGTHSIRVHPGMGEDDQLVVQQAMGEGRELALVPLGSTLSPRTLADQLTLVDATGATSWRDTFLGRTFAGSLRVAPLIAWLFVLVAVLQGAAAARAGWRRGLSKDDAKLATLAGLAGAFVLVRMEGSLAFAVPRAVLIVAAAVALALAGLPLVPAFSAAKAAASTEDEDPEEDEGSREGSIFARMASRVAAITRFPDRSGPVATETMESTVRAARVDGVFAALVLLSIALIVFAVAR